MEHTGLLWERRSGSGSGDQRFVVFSDAILFILPKKMHKQNPVSVDHPLRVVFLEGCSVSLHDDKKFPHGFIIRNHMNEVETTLRGNSKEDTRRWLQLIERAIATPEAKEFVERLQKQPNPSVVHSSLVTSNSALQLHKILEEEDASVIGFEPAGNADGTLGVAALRKIEAKTLTNPSSGSSPTSSTYTSDGDTEDDPASFPVLGFSTLEEIKAQPFDKQMIYAEISKMNEVYEEQISTEDAIARAAQLTELKKQKKVLVKELQKLRRNVTVHTRALDQAKSELEQLHHQKRERNHMLASKLDAISQLSARIHAADPDVRSEQFSRKRREKDSEQKESHHVTKSLDQQELARMAQSELDVLALSNTTLSEIESDAEQSLLGMELQRKGLAEESDPQQKSFFDAVELLLQLVVKNARLRTLVNKKYEVIYRMTQKKLEEFREDSLSAPR